MAGVDADRRDAGREGRLLRAQGRARERLGPQLGEALRERRLLGAERRLAAREQQQARGRREREAVPERAVVLDGLREQGHERLVERVLDDPELRPDAAAATSSRSKTATPAPPLRGTPRARTRRCPRR